MLCLYFTLSTTTLQSRRFCPVLQATRLKLRQTTYDLSRVTQLRHNHDSFSPSVFSPCFLPPHPRTETSLRDLRLWPCPLLSLISQYVPMTSAFIFSPTYSLKPQGLRTHCPLPFPLNSRRLSFRSQLVCCLQRSPLWPPTRPDPPATGMATPGPLSARHLSLLQLHAHLR